jgi:SMEK domain
MTKERETQIAECKELLIRLERWIAIDKFVRHQNGSIEVEHVLGSILNLVYGWKLENANDLFGRSQDSFDLLDDENGIVVPVTVTDSAEKIRQTLTKFIGKYDHTFKRLVFAYPIISPAESRADFSRDLNGFDFDATRDRLGLGTILSSAQPNQRLPLRDLLRRELGTLAAPLPDHQSPNVIIANTLIAKHGIHMHVPGEARATADLPTLILSAYARPLGPSYTYVGPYG